MSAEQDLPCIVNRQNGFTLRTAKPPRLGSLEFLAADRALEDLGERSGLGTFPFLGEEGDGFLEVLLDIEKLGKTEELEDFINLRLDFQKYEIASSGLDRFQERGKRTDTRAGNVI